MPDTPTAFKCSDLTQHKLWSITTTSVAIWEGGKRTVRENKDFFFFFFNENLQITDLRRNLGRLRRIRTLESKHKAVQDGFSIKKS